MATIIGNILRWTGSHASVKVRFVSLTRSAVVGASLIESGETTLRTGEDGDFSIELVMGDYEVTVNGKDKFLISVPNDDATYEITTRITSEVVHQPSAPVATEAQLVAWAESGAFELLTPAYDSQFRLTGGPVKWPDASSGTLTISAWSADGMPNAYAITHAASSRAVTQAAVTRNARGDITAKPALTISITP